MVAGLFRVLVVEDEPVIRELVHSLLTDLSCEVDLAPHAADGLKLAKTQSYDLILLDVVLPPVGSIQLDGVAVCRADTFLQPRVEAELAFLLVQKRLPSKGEARVLDAVLVSLADHGLTPIALAAHLLTGSMIVESVFNISGAGSIFVNAIQNRDAFLLCGAVVIYCTFLIFFNFIVDLLYSVLDKRIQLHA